MSKINIFLMKKIIYPIALVLLLMNFSCTKNNDGNKGIIKQETKKKKKWKG